MRILVFGIHPDDIELGCGGTVAVHTRAGHEVTLVDLTRGESSSNGTPEERAREADAAARILGCGDRKNLSLPDAGIRTEDPDQQRAVVEALRAARAHVVLAPFADDPHPDHASGGELIQRALYLAGIHGYRTASAAWNTPVALVYSGRREVHPDVVVDTSDVHGVKMDAIRAHASQFGARDGDVATRLNEPDFLDVVESRDRIKGMSIGVRYGEAFQTLSPVPLADVTALVYPEKSEG